MDTDGTERKESDTSIRGAHIPAAQIGIRREEEGEIRKIPIAQIGSYLSENIRAKGTNSSNSIREFHPRIHVPQELARVPLFGKFPEGQAS